MLLGLLHGFAARGALVVIALGLQGCFVAEQQQSAVACATLELRFLVRGDRVWWICYAHEGEGSCDAYREECQAILEEAAGVCARGDAEEAEELGLDPPSPVAAPSQAASTETPENIAAAAAVAGRTPGDTIAPQPWDDATRGPRGSRTMGRFRRRIECVKKVLRTGGRQDRRFHDATGRHQLYAVGVASDAPPEPSLMAGRFALAAAAGASAVAALAAAAIALRRRSTARRVAAASTPGVELHTIHRP